MNNNRHAPSPSYDLASSINKLEQDIYKSRRTLADSDKGILAKQYFLNTPEQLEKTYGFKAGIIVRDTESAFIRISQEFKEANITPPKELIKRFPELRYNFGYKAEVIAGTPDPEVTINIFLNENLIKTLDASEVYKELEDEIKGFEEIMPQYANINIDPLLTDTEFLKHEGNFDSEWYLKTLQELLEALEPILLEDNIINKLQAYFIRLTSKHLPLKYLKSFLSYLAWKVYHNGYFLWELKREVLVRQRQLDELYKLVNEFNDGIKSRAIYFADFAKEYKVNDDSSKLLGLNVRIREGFNDNKNYLTLV